MNILQSINIHNIYKDNRYPDIITLNIKDNSIQLDTKNQLLSASNLGNYYGINKLTMNEVNATLLGLTLHDYALDTTYINYTSEKSNEQVTVNELIRMGIMMLDLDIMYTQHSTIPINIFSNIPIFKILLNTPIFNGKIDTATIYIEM